MSKPESPILPSTTNLEIADVRQNDQGDITLTLPRGKFAEFLLGFLGPKETLSKAYNNDFIVRLEDILQFHHLLQQKIEKEQFISLSVATATLRYDDGTNRTINTVESLEKFNEYRHRGVISFSFVWQFALRTPNENAIRQQKINLLFDTKSKDGTGEISVSIEHTNQVWAVEVLQLFEEQIQKVKIPYSLAYRSLNTLNHVGFVRVLNNLVVAALILAVLAIVVLGSMRKEPVKVDAEFMFDVANVLSKNRRMSSSIGQTPGGGLTFDQERHQDDSIGGSQQPKKVSEGGTGPSLHVEVVPQFDLGLVTQFFLIKELRKSDPDIIDHLNKRGYFDARYRDVIDKLKVKYYDQDVGSETIEWSIQTQLAQARRDQNVLTISHYAKFIATYVFSLLVAGIYLYVFRMRSIIAITSKGISALEKQERDKSNMMQIIFGVVASLIAAFIYSYSHEFIQLLNR
jgi:hypothetical protein